MDNRFNLNEEEKNRIKGLHNIKVIKEQWEEVEIEETSQDEGLEMGGGSGFVENQGTSDSLSKFTKQQEVGEQSRNLDRVKSTSTDSESHEKFMTDLHSMCGQIEGMGDKPVGCRGKKCDGNKTDGSGGCYGPLIDLIKEYCKTK